MLPQPQPPPVPSSSASSASSPPPPSRADNMMMLYYGFVVVGTAALVLVIYNLVIMKWCGDSQRHPPPPPAEEVEEDEGGGGSNSSRSFDNSRANLITSFKYKKGGGGDEYECAVCLSVLEEGEEVRQLPRCMHEFHKSCIDMWLHSHLDCPICRSPVDPPLPVPTQALDRLSCPVRPARYSRGGLLDPSIFAL